MHKRTAISADYGDFCTNMRILREKSFESLSTIIKTCHISLCRIDTFLEHSCLEIHGEMKNNQDIQFGFLGIVVHTGSITLQIQSRYRMSLNEINVFSSNYQQFN